MDADHTFIRHDNVIDFLHKFRFRCLTQQRTYGVFGGADAGEVARGKGGLEIVPSGVSVEVKNFSCEIQPWDQFGFQGFCCYLVAGYAPGCDYASFISDIAGYLEFPSLEYLGQSLMVCVGMGFKE